MYVRACVDARARVYVCVCVGGWVCVCARTRVSKGWMKVVPAPLEVPVSVVVSPIYVLYVSLISPHQVRGMKDGAEGVFPSNYVQRH